MHVSLSGFRTTITSDILFTCWPLPQTELPRRAWTSCSGNPLLHIHLRRILRLEWQRVHLLWLCYNYIKITLIKSQCHKTFFSWKISSISNISKYNLLAWQYIHLKIQNWSFVLFVITFLSFYFILCFLNDICPIIATLLQIH